MRAGWEYKKLNEVCDKGNSNLVISKLEDNNGNYPLFGASGIVKGINFYQQEVPYIGIVKDGAGVGRVNIYPAKSSLVGTMQYIFPKEYCLLEYVKYFLIKLDLSKHVSGATIPHIYFKDYGKELIPLPPIPQQRLIVSELDKINSLIALKREQLKKYDELAQSLFYEMFGDPVENEKGWVVKKLGEVCIGKLKYGSGASAVEFDGRVRYVRITDIKEDGTLNNDAKSPSLIEDDYFLQEGDILFARSGATVGKTYIHQSSSISCLYAGYLIKAVPDQDVVLPLYLYNYTKSNFYRAWIDNNARAVAQPNINAKQYSDLLVPLPPLPLQRLFAHRIEQIEEQKKQITASLAKLETLLASRMQYWFE